MATLVEDAEPLLLLLFCCSCGPARRSGRCNYVYNCIPCIPTSYPLLPHHPTWVGWQEQPTHSAHPSYPESKPILHSRLLPHPTPSHPILPWLLLPSYPVLPYPTPSYTVVYCHPTTSYLVLHWILLPSYHSLPSCTHPIPFYPTLSYTGLSCHPTLSYLILPSLNPTNDPILQDYVMSVILPYNLIILPEYWCHPTPSYSVRYWITDYLSFINFNDEPLYISHDRTYRLQILNKSNQCSFHLTPCFQHLLDFPNVFLDL